MGGEPERTCVGCRRRSGKRDLLRIVRSPGGRLAPDPSGAAHGRGAYVHRDPACVRAVGRKGLLASVFGIVVGPEEAGRLRMEIEGALKTP